jgi:hypothetical protein
LVMEFKTTPAVLESSQPKANIQYKTTPTKVEILEKTPGKLEIDQKRAWESAGLGGVEFFSDQVYTESKQIVMQAIARIVEDGNKMANFRAGNVIPDLHESKPLVSLPFNYLATASLDNVDFHHTRKQLQFQVQPGELKISVQVSPPQYKFKPAVFDAYVKQAGSVTITPPKIDLFK